MKNSLFFALIRAGLWQTDIKDELKNQPYNWFEDVLKISYNQTVLGLVSEASLRCLFQQECTEANIAKQLIEQTKTVSNKHNYIISKVFDILQKEGIQPVLLKGQGLASYYPHPQLRQCGDIDIYVEPTSYAKALFILKETGATERKSKLTEKHHSYCINDIEIELHHYAEKMCNPFVNHIFQGWSHTQLATHDSHVTINGIKILTPPVNFNVIYVFCHLWNHFEIAGIGLRQLCDFAMLLHGESHNIDKKSLKEHLKRLRLLNAWEIVGSFMVNYLGLPQQEFPLYVDICSKKAEGFANLVINKGNFGEITKSQYTKNSTNKGKLARKLDMFIFRTRQFFSILPYSGMGIVWRAISHINKRKS